MWSQGFQMNAENTFVPALKKSERKIVITGLPVHYTDKEVKETFEVFCGGNSDDEENGQNGDIDSKILSCKASGNGSAYVLFSKAEAAQRAMTSKMCLGIEDLQIRFAMIMDDDNQNKNVLAPANQTRNVSKFSGRRASSENDIDLDVKTVNRPIKDEYFTSSYNYNNFRSQMPGLDTVAEDDKASLMSGSSGNSVGSFGCGKAAQAAKITFGASTSSSNNSNGMSINMDGDAVFGSRISSKERKSNLYRLSKCVISQHDAFEFIDRFIGPKEKCVLILGELDFSFALSVVRGFGHGHKVICSSLHTNQNMNRLYNVPTVNAIKSNIGNIRKFHTGYNGKNTLVYRGFNALKMRESLVKQLGNDIGSIIAFDKIVFALPLASGSNAFDIRNFCWLRRLFENINEVVNRDGSSEKAEIHLIMPIFSTRSQFESYKIEEIGKYCNLKWRLKTVRIFDNDKLSTAFRGYVQRDNSGKSLNKRNHFYNYGGYSNRYNRFNNKTRTIYTGYYILETL